MGKTFNSNEREQHRRIKIKKQRAFTKKSIKRSTQEDNYDGLESFEKFKRGSNSKRIL